MQRGREKLGQIRRSIFPARYELERAARARFPRFENEERSARSRFTGFENEERTARSHFSPSRIQERSPRSPFFGPGKREQIIGSRVFRLQPILRSADFNRRTASGHAGGVFV